MLTQDYLQYLQGKQAGLINVSRVKSTAFVKYVPLLIWHLRLLERLIHVRLSFLALAKTYPCSLGILALAKTYPCSLGILALAKTYPCALGIFGFGKDLSMFARHFRLAVFERASLVYDGGVMHTVDCRK